MTDDLKDTTAIIAEILVLCRDNPSLRKIASHGLSGIVAQFDGANEAKNIAQRTIDEYMARCRKNNVPSKHVTSVELRQFAVWFAKRRHISFEPKTIKRKEDLLAWLSDNWNEAENEFSNFLKEHCKITKA